MILYICKLFPDKILVINSHSFGLQLKFCVPTSKTPKKHIFIQLPFWIQKSIKNPKILKFLKSSKSQLSLNVYIYGCISNRQKVIRICIPTNGLLLTFGGIFHMCLESFLTSQLSAESNQNIARHFNRILRLKT